MALMRRVAALGAAVAAARQYARQNPEKVNRYADQAASFIDQRTHGRFRRQLDTALRQVRKETSVPGRGAVRAEPGRPVRPAAVPHRRGGRLRVTRELRHPALPQRAHRPLSSIREQPSAHHLLEEAADAVLAVHEVHLEDPVAAAPGGVDCAVHRGVVARR